MRPARGNGILRVTDDAFHARHVTRDHGKLGDHGSFVFSQPLWDHLDREDSWVTLGPFNAQRCIHWLKYGFWREPNGLATKS